MPSARFSESIRKDILKVQVRDREEARAEIASMLSCSNPVKVDGGMRILSSSSPLGAERLARLLREEGIVSETRPVGKAGSETGLFITETDYCRMAEFADAFRSEAFSDDGAITTRQRRAALRGAFMVCGVASDPRRTYRIELHIKDPLFARATLLLMHAEDIEPSRMLRNGKNILYVKEGAQIADFLAMIGAYISLLFFENIRTDKEIRNQVNRTVNCDTANARRQAEAGARRGESLRSLLTSAEGVRLPKELRDAAEVLIENPGLSIKELGELMDPPIGKSGMHHRLRKLERYAEEAGSGSKV